VIIFKRLKQEKQDRAAADGKNIDGIPGAEEQQLDDRERHPSNNRDTHMLHPIDIETGQG
jgi:hypothetical protein